MLMAGDTLLDMGDRGDGEKESRADLEVESQPHKRLSHSIEEILRRPTYVGKGERVYRDWSVITENTRRSNQLTRAGMLLFSFYAPKKS